jgi:hypothetical protein
MKSGIIPVAALVIVACGNASAPAQPGRPGNETFDPDARRNGWIFSLQDGQALARKTNKPLMVVLRCNP